MSSHNLRKHDEFDASIGQELRSWASRQHPLADVRAAVLQAASRRSRKTARAVRTKRIWHRVRNWFVAPHTRRLPTLPQNELTQWLFSQAMWHNLGNDRRAVRFVC